MNEQRKRLSSNKGLTLVELLATITILSIIGVLIYSVLFNGMKSYERTMEESKLRDEADYIMANLIDHFFSIKVSDVIELPDANGGKNYVTILQNGEEKIFGFKNGDVYVSGEKLALLDSNVQITDESTIIPMNESEFAVKLVLQMKDSERTMELTSVINIIDDQGGGELIGLYEK
ncbi:PulJ/GspJ family protein [Fervidibacillus albus]|uniref:Prepilin-type N-terminal cleavage/methylation domain-containing protein n=1 Tax=Fervidibacillus albus TaxID=2980026 RepID=A0A9E8RVF4_9BACI|nr:prepilin-type N-terminal cleavage/methylation domain-containing protein [Fervidibacillus albus]WAA08868.1 prepilin-type N-terminal cleavage/methylation domain-containing protein [Fervidibacillus albus]